MCYIGHIRVALRGPVKFVGCSRARGPIIMPPPATTPGISCIFVGSEFGRYGQTVLSELMQAVYMVCELCISPHQILLPPSFSITYLCGVNDPVLSQSLTKINLCRSNSSEIVADKKHQEIQDEKYH